MVEWGYRLIGTLLFLIAVAFGVAFGVSPLLSSVVVIVATIATQVLMPWASARLLAAVRSLPKGRARYLGVWGMLGVVSGLAAASMYNWALERLNANAIAQPSPPRLSTIRISVMDAKEDGAPWDIGGGLPDIALCVTHGRTTHCYPEAAGPEAVRSPWCQDQVSCTFVNIEIPQGAIIRVLDVDLSENDMIGQGICDGNAVCRIGRASIEFNPSGVVTTAPISPLVSQENFTPLQRAADQLATRSFDPGYYVGSTRPNPEGVVLTYINRLTPSVPVINFGVTYARHPMGPIPPRHRRIRVHGHDGFRSDDGGLAMLTWRNRNWVFTLVTRSDQTPGEMQFVDVFAHQLASFADQQPQIRYVDSRDAGDH